MKHLVLLGAGHAHVHVLEGLAKRMPNDVRVTLIAPFDEQLYSGMVPGFVAGHYTLDECTIGLQRLICASGVQFIKSTVASINADNQTLHLSNGQAISYDVLSLNTGAGMDLEKIEAMMPGARENALFVRPMPVFVKLWPQVLALAASRPLHLAVVGAGAAGLELAMAAAHKLRGPEYPPGSRITLVTGGLAPAQSYPPGVQRRVLSALKRLQIAVVEDSCVAVNEGELALGSGAKLATDVPLLAIGVQAPAWLATSGLALDEKGYLAVDHFQQSTSHALVFAVGDVCSRIDAPHSRSGVYAVHAGPPLLRNLLAAVIGSGSQPLTPYAPPARTLNLLSCGGRYAIAAWGRFSVEGAWVWRLKDRIDRKFVRRYSA